MLFSSELRTGQFQFVLPSVSDRSLRVRRHTFAVFFCISLCSAVVCSLHLIAMNGTEAIRRYFVILHCYW